MPLPSDPSTFTMGLGDHIEDLRRRVIAALILPLPLAIGLFFVADLLLAWLILPLQKVQLSGGWTPTLQVLSPPEFLLLEMKLSIVAALVLALPWILWQGWRFIAPGLYPHERRYVYILIPGLGAPCHRRDEFVVLRHVAADPASAHAVCRWT